MTTDSCVISYKKVYEGCSDTDHGLVDITKLEEAGGICATVAQDLRKQIEKNANDLSLQFGYPNSEYSYDDWEIVREVFYEALVEPPQEVVGVLDLWMG